MAARLTYPTATLHITRNTQKAPHAMYTTQYTALDTQAGPGSKRQYAKLGSTVLYLGGDPGAPRKWAMTEGVVVAFGKTKIKVFFADRPGGKPVPIGPQYLVLRTEAPLVDIETLGVKDPSVVKEWDLDRVVQAIRDIPARPSGDSYGPPATRTSRVLRDGRPAEAVTLHAAIEATRSAFGIRNRSDAEQPLRAALDAGRVLWLRSDGGHLASALEPIPFAERKTEETYTHRWVSAYRRLGGAPQVDEDGFLGRFSGGRPPAAARTQWVILPDALAAFQAAEKAKVERRAARQRSEADADRERFEAKHPRTLEAVRLLLEQAGIEPVYQIGRELYYRAYERETGTRSELDISVVGPQVAALGGRLRALLALEAGVAVRFDAEEREEMRAQGARELGWPVPPIPPAPGQADGKRADGGQEVR